MEKQARPYSALESYLRIFVAFLLTMVLLPPLIIATVPLLPWRRLRVRVGNVYGKCVGRFGVFAGGWRPIIHNRERLDSHRPAVYVANHASTLDVLLGMWLCPMGGVGTGKKEVAYVPFFGWAYYLSGHLLLNRQNRSSAIQAMSRVGELVRKNRMSVWIWPEGTRAMDGRLTTFKKGFAHLVLATRLPVVPVIMHHTHLRWPNKTYQLVPGDVHINVLPPVDTSHWTLENLDQHIAEIRAIMAAHLSPDQKPLDALAVAS